MVEISNINTKRALDDPEAEFASPVEIVTKVGLTRGQKISSLQKWKFLVQRRLDSSSEGMPPAEEGAQTADSELLRRLNNALDGLRQPNDVTT